MCFDGLFGTAKNGIARQFPRRDLDRQRINHDPIGECRVQRERDAVANERGELRREEPYQCRRARQPEDGLGRNRQRYTRIEMSERAGGGGDPPVPIGERPGSVDRQPERRAVGASEHPVEQDAGRLVRRELKLQDRGFSGKLHCQYDISGGVVGAVDIERDLRRLARELGTAFHRCDETVAQHWGSER